MSIVLIADADFNDLLHNLQSDKLSNEQRLDLISSAAESNTFTSDMLMELLQVTISMKTRVSIVSMIIPVLTDPKVRREEILNYFRFSPDKNVVVKYFDDRERDLKAANSKSKPKRKKSNGRFLGESVSRSISHDNSAATNTELATSSSEVGPVRQSSQLPGHSSSMENDHITSSVIPPESANNSLRSAEMVDSDGYRSPARNFILDSSGGVSPKKTAMQKEDPLRAQSPRTKMELNIDLRRQNVRQASVKNDRKEMLKSALAWMSDHSVGRSSPDSTLEDDDGSASGKFDTDSRQYLNASHEDSSNPLRSDGLQGVLKHGRSSNDGKSANLGKQVTFNAVYEFSATPPPLSEEDDSDTNVANNNTSEKLSSFLYPSSPVNKNRGSPVKKKGTRHLSGRKTYDDEEEDDTTATNNRLSQKTSGARRISGRKSYDDESDNEEPHHSCSVEEIGAQQQEEDVEVKDSKLSAATIEKNRKPSKKPPLPVEENFAPTSPLNKQSSNIGSRHLLSASQTTTASPPESVIDTDHQLNHCADQHESMDGNDNMQVDELLSEVVEDGSGMSSMKGIVTKAAGDFDKDEGQAPDSKAASMDRNVDISSAVEKTLSTAVNDDAPDKRERRDFYATDMDENDMQKEKLVQATASGGTQQKSIPPQSAQNSGVGSRHLLSASQTTTASPPESVIDTDHQLNHCADQHESMGGNDNMQVDELLSEVVEDGNGTSSMKGVVTKTAGDFVKNEGKSYECRLDSVDFRMGPVVSRQGEWPTAGYNHVRSKSIGDEYVVGEAQPLGSQPMSDFSDRGGDDVFNPQRMLDSIVEAMGACNDEASSTNTFSTKASRNSSSRFRLAKMFVPKRRKSRTAINFSLREEFIRIRDSWQTKAHEAGCSLPKAVISEMNKRIDKAGSKKEKPKFAFISSGLSDQQVILLINVLAERPVIEKVELSGNKLSTNSALQIRKLLASQIQLSFMMDPLSRVNAVFLAEITMGRNKGDPIDVKVAEDISMMCSSLRRTNAQNSIRKCFLDLGAPTVISEDILFTMWTELVGAADKKKITTARAAVLSPSTVNDGTTSKPRPALNRRSSFTSALGKEHIVEGGAGSHDTGGLVYSEVEAIIMEGMMRKGLITALNKKDEDAVKALILPFAAPMIKLGAPIDLEKDNPTQITTRECGSVSSEVNAEYSSREVQEEDSRIPYHNVDEKFNVRAEEVEKAVMTAEEMKEDSVPSVAAHVSVEPNVVNIVGVEEGKSGFEGGHVGVDDSDAEEVEKAVMTAEEMKEDSVPSVAAHVSVEPNVVNIVGVEEGKSGFEALPMRNEITLDSSVETLCEDMNHFSASSELMPTEDAENEKLKYKYTSFLEPRIEERNDSQDSIPQRINFDENDLGYNMYTAGNPDYDDVEVGPVQQSSKSRRDKLKLELSIQSQFRDFPDAMQRSRKSSAPQLAIVNSCVEDAEEGVGYHLHENSNEDEICIDNPLLRNISTKTAFTKTLDFSSSNLDLSRPSRSFSVQLLPHKLPESISSNLPSSFVPDSHSRDQNVPDSSGDGQKCHRNESKESKLLSPVDESLIGRKLKQQQYLVEHSEMVQEKIHSSEQLPDAQTNRKDQRDGRALHQQHELQEEQSESYGENTGVDWKVPDIPSFTQFKEIRASPTRDIREDIGHRDDSFNFPGIAECKSVQDVDKVSVLPCVTEEVGEINGVGKNNPDLSSCIQSKETSTPPLRDFHQDLHGDHGVSFTIPGITQRKFSLQEIEKLSALPQCVPEGSHCDDAQSSIDSYNDDEVGLIGGRSCDANLLRNDDLAISLEPTSDMTIAEFMAPNFSYVSPSAAKNIDSFSPWREKGKVGEVLHLEDQGLRCINFNDNSDDSGRFSRIREMYIRGNAIEELASLQLPDLFFNLLVLDAGFNQLGPTISVGSLPYTLISLDLRNNKIRQTDGIIGCINLKELNLSHNLIEKVSPLPFTLEKLDISYNLIWGKQCLREIALCTKLLSICVWGNPVTILSNCRAILRSLLPNLQFADCERLSTVTVRARNDQAILHRNDPRSTSKSRFRTSISKSATENVSRTKVAKSSINSRTAIDPFQADGKRGVKRRDGKIGIIGSYSQVDPSQISYAAKTNRKKNVDQFHIDLNNSEDETSGSAHAPKNRQKEPVRPISVSYMNTRTRSKPEFTASEENVVKHRRPRKSTASTSGVGSSFQAQVASKISTSATLKSEAVSQQGGFNKNGVNHARCLPNSTRKYQDTSSRYAGAHLTSTAVQKLQKDNSKRSFAKSREDSRTAVAPVTEAILLPKSAQSSDHVDIGSSNNSVTSTLTKNSTSTVGGYRTRNISQSFASPLSSPLRNLSENRISPRNISTIDWSGLQERSKNKIRALEAGVLALRERSGPRFDDSRQSSPRTPRANRTSVANETPQNDSQEVQENELIAEQWLRNVENSLTSAANFFHQHLKEVFRHKDVIKCGNGNEDFLKQPPTPPPIFDGSYIDDFGAAFYETGVCDLLLTPADVKHALSALPDSEIGMSVARAQTNIRNISLLFRRLESAMLVCIPSSTMANAEGNFSEEDLLEMEVGWSGYVTALDILMNEGLGVAVDSNLLDSCYCKPENVDAVFPKRIQKGRSCDHKEIVTNWIDEEIPPPPPLPPPTSCSSAGASQVEVDYGIISESKILHHTGDASEDMIKEAMNAAAVILNTAVDIAASNLASQTKITIAELNHFRDEWQRIPLLNGKIDPVLAAHSAVSKSTLEQWSNYLKIFKEIDDRLETHAFSSVPLPVEFHREFKELMRSELGMKVNEAAFFIFDEEDFD